MTKQLLFCVSLGAGLSITAYAQHNPGQVSSPATGTSTSIPGNAPGNSQPNTPGTSPLEQPQPLYITGKVVMDDGTPPPDPVAIQLVCGVVPHTVTFTDAKGHFSVDLNDRMARSEFADATDGDAFGRPQPGQSPYAAINSNQAGPGSFGLGGRDLMSCQLEASQAGFRSDVVQLGTRHRLDNPDVGTFTLRRLAGVNGLTISATGALAPKDAKKDLEKGLKAETAKKWPEAQKELQKAVKSYPKYAAAWYELGNVQRYQDDLEGARDSYAKALEADPKFVMPYGQLAAMAAKEKKWQEVVDDSNHLLQLDPIDFPQAWVLNAVGYYALRKWDLAEKSAKEGLTHDPQHRYPKLNEVLGTLLAMEKDYSGSVQNLRDYLRYAPNAPDAEQVKKHLAELDKVLEPQANKE